VKSKKSGGQKLVEILKDESQNDLEKSAQLVAIIQGLEEKLDGCQQDLTDLNEKYQQSLKE
jgi:hypothetical protein